MPQTDAAEIRRRIRGVLLQAARLRAGRTQRECAEVIGVSPAAIENYEQGRCDFSLPELELLAYFLSVPVVAFIEGEGDSLVDEKTTPSIQVMSLRHRIIGALLREARLQKGKSTKDMAALLHCTPRRITRYEQGQTSVPLSHLETAAEYLDLPLAHFLDEGVGSIGERELQDRQYESFKSLPEDVRAFVVNPANLAYLRSAMHLAEMPADTIRTIAAGLLDITY